MALRIARLFERRSHRRRQHAAVGGADAARPHLCEARAVPGDAAGRGRHRARARSRVAAGPDGAVPAGRGRGDHRGGARPAAGEAVHLVRPGGRGCVDRAGASRRGRLAGRAEVGRGEGAAARHRAALRRRSRRLHVRRPQRRALLGRGAAAADDRRRRQPAPHLRHGAGSAARGGGALRDGGEHPQRSRFPRARGRLGPHRAHGADARLDRRHSALRPRRGSKPPGSISRRWRAR